MQNKSALSLKYPSTIDILDLKNYPNHHLHSNYKILTKVKLMTFKASRSLKLPYNHSQKYRKACQPSPHFKHNM